MKFLESYVTIAAYTLIGKLLLVLWLYSIKLLYYKTVSKSYSRTIDLNMTSPRSQNHLDFRGERCKLNDSCIETSDVCDMCIWDLVRS